MNTIDNLIITKYHPILIDDKWVFPINAKSMEIVELQYCDVYNVCLENGESLNVEGYDTVTLGGFKDYVDDIVYHEYFSVKVLKLIETLPVEDGVHTFDALLYKECRSEDGSTLIDYVKI